MSGSQPPPAGQPPGNAAGDPSMEDILASIRRILSEDEPQPAAPAAAAPPEPVPPADDDDDVLILDPSMEVAAEPPPLSDPVEDVLATFRERDPEPEPQHEPEPEPAFEPMPMAMQMPPVLPVAPEPLPQSTPPAVSADLMAPETEAAAASSVSGLVRRLASERSTHVWAGGPTIEDLVREEVRPLLKQWLDTNLPDMVERLVRAEIERVVRRAVP
jgi:cell pole-organizing protein PopZ